MGPLVKSAVRSGVWVSPKRRRSPGEGLLVKLAVFSCVAVSLELSSPFGRHVIFLSTRLVATASVGSRGGMTTVNAPDDVPTGP